MEKTVIIRYEPGSDHINPLAGLEEGAFDQRGVTRASCPPAELTWAEKARAVWDYPIADYNILLAVFWCVAWWSAFPEVCRKIWDGGGSPSIGNVNKG